MDVTYIGKDKPMLIGHVAKVIHEGLRRYHIKFYTGSMTGKTIIAYTEEIKKI